MKRHRVSSPTMGLNLKKSLSLRNVREPAPSSMAFKCGTYQPSQWQSQSPSVSNKKRSYSPSDRMRSEHLKMVKNGQINYRRIQFKKMKTTIGGTNERIKYLNQ